MNIQQSSSVKLPVQSFSRHYQHNSSTYLASVCTEVLVECLDRHPLNDKSPHRHQRSERSTHCHLHQTDIMMETDIQIVGQNDQNVMNNGAKFVCITSLI